MARKSIRDRQDVQSFIQEKVLAGLTDNKIILAVRKQFGQGYMRQQMLEDIRSYKARPEPTPEEKRKHTPRKFRTLIISKRKTRRGDPLGILNWKRKYNHIVNYTIKNTETKETMTEDFTLITDNADITPRQAELKTIELINQKLAKDIEGSPTLEMIMSARFGEWKLIKSSVTYIETIVRQD